MKKFWNWLIGKAWIEYMGNHKYCVKQRRGLVTKYIDHEMFGWLSPSNKHHFQVDLPTAHDIMIDCDKLGKMVK